VNSTRERREYATLDGLRALAALAVVLMHAGALAPRAYLAVDLFFLLSGFVLEHAYGPRLAAGWRPFAFVHQRFRRLYPLYGLGLAIAVAAVGAALLLHRGPDWTWGQFATVAALEAVMLPAWLRTDHRMYALDFPAWTLLAELVVNLVWAAAYRQLTRTRLIVWVVVGGVVLAGLAVAHGSLNAGSEWETSPLGFARAFFAFPLGVLLRRTVRGALPARNAAFVFFLAALILFLAPARFGLAYDLLAAFVIWPAVIAVGALTEPSQRFKPVAMAAGAASFGVYITAVPIYVLVHAVAKSRGLPGEVLPAPWALAYAAGLFAGTAAIRWILQKRSKAAW
jgi:peptidoglycan/LPS O-acetylase OafA/YrhL